jgi:hypothetical protein
VKRLVIGAGAGSGMREARLAERPVAAGAGFGLALTGGGAAAGFAGATLTGTFLAGVAALLASVLFNWVSLPELSGNQA